MEVSFMPPPEGVSDFISVGVVERGMCAKSDDWRYRYMLGRMWDGSRPYVGVLGINPSVADHQVSDNTVAVLTHRFKTQKVGERQMGGFMLYNPYAIINTNAAEVKPSAYSIGPHNADYIKNAVDMMDDWLVAWGQPGLHLDAKRWVLEVLLAKKRRLWCLGTTEDGTPRHPLRLAYTVPIIPWTPNI